MRQIRTALVGYGPGGRTYNAPIIKSVPGYQIDVILTSSKENIKAATEDFPEAEVVQEYNKILQNPAIDLVVLVLPNHLHFSYARQALEAGKHVLLEKPFTTHVKDANDLIKLAHEKQLVLSVNHNRRWDSDFQTVKKVAESGLLGNLVAYEAHFDRFRNEVKPGWKEEKEIAGNGILYDLGSHLIDQALHLFGLPQEVFADIRVEREAAEVPDSFELLLFYPHLKVTLKAGMLVKEKGATYSLFGTKGSFVKQGADVQEEALKQRKDPQTEPNWGIEPEEIWGKLSTTEEERKVKSEKGDYRKVYTGLYNAITTGDVPTVTAAQARDVIRIIEAAHRSQDERRVVTFQ
ncbi:Gfo/Idh/MocA family oxidoreductase [Salinimicrobium oceani]|uniref:Gfo/Idh/MocA family oxidoreductase n=1 Tax=Salinimicrobium oceani TaxID=2722702 RepID=A0ABX1D3H2_9FLAO|nr:Gfo/Idh/MocA family oxidoreductase [Salinimicrobium oceani]NJW53743.1 Gfo/Idh/MocA family oxidoreductase [Salinimicrobium oceani]